MAMETRSRSTPESGAEADELTTELIMQLARRTAFESAAQLAPLGLTPAQFAVVDFLLSGRSSATQAEIARSVGVEQPTMAATLRRMERDNLIVRVADPADGRQSFVSPTPAVKRKRAKLAAARHRVEATVLAALDETERRELRRLLTKVQTASAVVRPRTPSRHS
ncbi:DNA-binding transcriptional regulator, MarR family [Nakamurella panacisegetis]|uniref:DNA-binding transcriptional regulator, MarR family n=1 Tax=Nakamurella panacisegetis TaxID=1090615 RepID=A0A1H0KK96_9ACTN|nr:MarR family transcriptional regulator [Nakamurella panacisegetis]SDO56369.1 DNA-binding transcriptional regulator, MarR family [Nakamurella panacisegetis]